MPNNGNPKIDIYVNGEYECSTGMYKTCKDAIINYKLTTLYNYLTKETELVRFNNVKVTAHIDKAGSKYARNR